MPLQQGCFAGQDINGDGARDRVRFEGASGESAYEFQVGTIFISDRAQRQREHLYHHQRERDHFTADSLRFWSGQSGTNLSASLRGRFLRGTLELLQGSRRTRLYDRTVARRSQIDGRGDRQKAPRYGDIELLQLSLDRRDQRRQA